ncbi:hypothetical protein ACH0BO_04495 [Brevibacterium luteolum]|uniref:hypothetical protein n=1 Tax=Brevibacterium luteolum TaxID=199591 RepID=UPI0038794967
MDEHEDAPPIPTGDSTLPDTRRYLDYLYEVGSPITVRDLIQMWGARARGRHVIRAVTGDLEKLGYAVVPPIDSGNLDTVLTLNRTQDERPGSVVQKTPDPHMLTLARFQSAVAATQSDEAGEGRSSGTLLTAKPNDQVASVATEMLRMDYSQVPVLHPHSRDIPLGVFSWRSYAKAMLSGDAVTVVGDAMESVQPVDLHSDLFSNIADISEQGYCLAMYQGRLTGIVTATDLVAELEELAIPFLAVGRVERELKRVAKLYGLADNDQIDGMMFGNLQYLYRDEWARLPWNLAKSQFIDWIDATRQLRNAISHHDETEGNLKEVVAEVHRMTEWLSMHGDSDDAASSGKDEYRN